MGLASADGECCSLEDLDDFLEKTSMNQFFLVKNNAMSSEEERRLGTTY